MYLLDDRRRCGALAAIARPARFAQRPQDGALVRLLARMPDADKGSASQRATPADAAEQPLRKDRYSNVVNVARAQSFSHLARPMVTRFVVTCGQLLASSHPLACQVFAAAIRGRSLTSRAEVTAWCVLLCEAVLPAQRSLRSSDRDWKRFLLQSERDLHPKKPLALASRCQGQ